MTPAEGVGQTGQVLLEQLLEDAQGDSGVRAAAGPVMTSVHISRDLASLAARAAARSNQPVSALVDAALRRYLLEDPSGRPQPDASPLERR